MTIDAGLKPEGAPRRQISVTIRRGIGLSQWRGFSSGLDVTQEENELLNTTGIDQLMTLVEEATRGPRDQ